MKIRSEFPDYKTTRQWALQGYLPVDGAEGVELWANNYCQDCYIYYAPSEVGKATEEQIHAFFKPEREHRNALARERRRLEKEQRERDREREAAYERRMMIYNAVKPYLDYISELRNTIWHMSTNNAPCSNGSKYLVIDTETTGVDPFGDELLQVSIIDSDGNTLFNSYFKPFAVSWNEAEKINGISPEMVADSPRISEKIAEISNILYDAKAIIGYNTRFDLNFLMSNGVIIPDKVNVIDVMEDFAEIYGDFDEHHGNYRWQKLTTAAKYYNYDWNSRPEGAHNSLADCYATLYVYNKMNEIDTV